MTEAVNVVERHMKLRDAIDYVYNLRLRRKASFDKTTELIQETKRLDDEIRELVEQVRTETEALMSLRIP